MCHLQGCSALTRLGFRVYGLGFRGLHVSFTGMLCTHSFHCESGVGCGAPLLKALYSHEIHDVSKASAAAASSVNRSLFR